MRTKIGQNPVCRSSFHFIKLAAFCTVTHKQEERYGFCWSKNPNGCVKRNHLTTGSLVGATWQGPHQITREKIVTGELHKFENTFSNETPTSAFNWVETFCSERDKTPWLHYHWLRYRGQNVLNVLPFICTYVQNKQTNKIFLLLSVLSAYIASCYFATPSGPNPATSAHISFKPLQSAICRCTRLFPRMRN